MPKPSASYARLSNTRDSSEPNTAFQHTRNREYLESLGYTVTKEYTEPTGMRSGRFLAKRPAMQQLVKDLSQYQAVAFFDFTRFSRNTEFAFEFLRNAEKLKIKVLNTSTRDAINTDNASEFLKTGTQAIFSEYESRKGSERMKNAYRRAHENGWVALRRAPLGFKLVGSKQDRRLEKDETFKVVAEIFRLLADGVTPGRLATQLRKRGFRARTYDGKPVDFNEYHVWNIVRHAERYKPYVSSDIYKSALRRIAERRGTSGAAISRTHPPLILHHILRCAVCGHLFTASWDKTPSGELKAQYRHQTHYTCINAHKIYASKIDAQVYAMLEKFGRRMSKTSFVEMVYAKQRKETPKENTQAKRAALLRKLQVAKERLVSEDIDLADYRKFKDAIEKQLDELAIPERETEIASIEEIRKLFESAGEWKRRAEKAPEQLNLVLRDLFESITIGQDNRLKFKPLPHLRRYFRGLV